jgi:Ca-activated chloride channel homolog
MMKTRWLVLLMILVLAMAACSPEDDSDETINDEQPPIQEPSNNIPAPTPQMTAQARAETEEEIADGDVMMEFEAADDMALAGAPAAQAPGAIPPAQPPQEPAPVGTPAAMTFEDAGVNPFYDTEDDNLSTFAMDVDTGSYTVARNYLMGQEILPPEDAIRPEEFINYFPADYDSPEDDDAFAIHLEAAPAPYGYDGHYLLRVGLQGRYIAPEDRDPVFLTFVIDVSGSMDMENRLGLVKETLGILLGELREDDRVAIVVYSNNSRAILEPTPASETETILSGIDALQPEGSTNVEDGLRLAYELTESAMREDENTRVIVLSDGVANVGNTGPDSILNTIRSGVDAGITLSTIGFGMGNYNDALMEQLANDGNGNYYYVDNLREARRVFVHNLTGTLQVIGYDARVQVDFNPEVTDRYRLIGYENRAIADEDFRDDTVDAGEVGAGHSVTALYELALEDADAEGVVATVFIRYEDAETREVVELSREITTDDLLTSFDAVTPSLKLQAAVAEFAELLRGSTWAEDGSYGAVMAMIEDAGYADDEDVAELVAMVETAVRLGDQ